MELCPDYVSENIALAKDLKIQALSEAHETGQLTLNLSNSVTSVDLKKLLASVPNKHQLEFLDSYKSSIEAAIEYSFIAKQCGGNPFTDEKIKNDLDHSFSEFVDRQKELLDAYKEATAIDFIELASQLENCLIQNLTDDHDYSDSELLRKNLLNACKSFTQATNTVAGNYKMGNKSTVERNSSLDNFVTKTKELAVLVNESPFSDARSVVKKIITQSTECMFLN